jgi:hypothetical protein
VVVPKKLKPAFARPLHLKLGVTSYPPPVEESLFQHSKREARWKDALKQNLDQWEARHLVHFHFFLS